MESAATAPTPRIFVALILTISLICLT
jgi:hypothetical protein